MKNFLFSKTHKKHYSDTVVRMGKNNLGFSLVELIIVIAIMAILVAIAIPVLGVFIEKAKIANDKQAVKDVLYAIDLGGQSMSYGIEPDQIGNSTALKVPIGVIILGNNGVSVIGSNAANETALHKMLEDTLGVGYTESLKLQHENWEGAAYASFFSSADDMMDKVDSTGKATLDYLNDLNDNAVLSLAGVSYDENGNIKAYKKVLGKVIYDKKVNIVSRGYSSSEELTYSLAQAISNVDRDVFISTWANLSSEASEGFGLVALPNADGSINQNPAREYYSAVRAAYSQCFANYVVAHHSDKDTNWEDHSNDIMGWGESGNKMLEGELSFIGTIAGALTGADDMTFPWAVCGETFANHNDSNAGNDDFVDCSYCEALWKEYYQSAQAKADAAAFYDTMVTGAAYEATDANNDGTVAPGEGIINWAKTETDVFTNLYDRVSTETKGNDFSIMITVYQDPETSLLYGECNTPGVLDE